MKRRNPLHDEQQRIHDALEFVRALHRDMFISHRISAHICETINLILTRFTQETFLIREVYDAVGYASHQLFDQFKEQIRWQKNGMDENGKDGSKKQEGIICVTPGMLLRNIRLMAAIYMLGAHVTPEAAAEASGFKFADVMNNALKKYTGRNADTIYERFGPLANAAYNDHALWTEDHRRKLEGIFRAHQWDWKSILNGDTDCGEF